MQFIIFKKFGQLLNKINSIIVKKRRILSPVFYLIRRRKHIFYSNYDLDLNKKVDSPIENRIESKYSSKKGKILSDNFRKKIF